MYHPRDLTASEQAKVLEYFDNIETSSLCSFRENWDALERCRHFQGRQLSRILKSVSERLAIHEFESIDQKKGAASYARRNFSFWEKRALNHIKNFTAMDLAITVRAMAILKAQPSEKFLKALEKQIRRKEHKFSPIDNAFKAWGLQGLDTLFPNLKLADFYKSFRQKIRTAKLNGPKGLKPVYHADLHFFGSSTIDRDSIVEEGKEAWHSGNEDRLQTLFHQFSGFIVRKLDQAPITELPQAVDRVIEYAPTGEIIYAEMDGWPHFDFGDRNQRKSSNDGLLAVSREAVLNTSSIMRSDNIGKFTDQAVVRIDEYLFAAVLKWDRRKQEVFCRGLFKMAAQSEPDCYRFVTTAPNLIRVAPQRLLRPEETFDATSPASGQSAPRPGCGRGNEGPLVLQNPLNSQSPEIPVAPAAFQ